MNRIRLSLILVCLLAPAPASLAQTPPVTPPAPTRVLLDRSHEVPAARTLIEAVFNKSGIGVIRSDAALASVRDELSRCQALLIWQEYTTVPYTPAEVALIRDFVAGGGTLILVGNVVEWTTRNKPAGPQDYPLFTLAAALGVRLADADFRKDIGKGRLVYLHRCDVLTYANLQTEANGLPGKAAERLLSGIPDRRLASSPVSRVINPDKTFTVGPVQVLYPGNLSARAEPLQGFLRQVLPVLEKMYDCQLEAQVTVGALPCTGTPWIPAHNFDVDLAASPDTLAGDFAKQLAYCWYFPGGRDVTLPTWITLGWTDAASARAMAVVGFAPRADSLLRGFHRQFLAVDPRMNQLDLSVYPPGPAISAYQGKAIYILQTLEKQTGINVIARLRKTVRVAHAAGDFEDVIDSDETIRLLSLGLGQNLYPFFASLGVKVAPKPLDFQRFRALEAEFDRLLSTK